MRSAVVMVMVQSVPDCAFVVRSTFGETPNDISWNSFIHSFIRGGGWPLAVFRRAFQPTTSAEA